MPQISIPDPIYAEAVRRARVVGVTLERFVLDALRLHMEDEPEGLVPTPELISSLHKAEAEINAGKGLSMHQVEQNLTARRAEWLETHPR